MVLTAHPGGMRHRKPAMANHVTPSGRETFFSASELIVSKTDLKGRITYANRLFCRSRAIANLN